MSSSKSILSYIKWQREKSGLHCMNFCLKIAHCKIIIGLRLMALECIHSMRCSTSDLVPLRPKMTVDKVLAMSQIFDPYIRL